MIVGLENYLAQFGAWVTVTQGVIFVVCVLAFRRGIIGEIGGQAAHQLCSTAGAAGVATAAAAVLCAAALLIQACDPGRFAGRCLFRPARSAPRRCSGPSSARLGGRPLADRRAPTWPASSGDRALDAEPDALPTRRRTRASSPRSPARVRPRWPRSAGPARRRRRRRHGAGLGRRRPRDRRAAARPRLVRHRVPGARPERLAGTSSRRGRASSRWCRNRPRCAAPCWTGRSRTASASATSSAPAATRDIGFGLVLDWLSRDPGTGAILLDIRRIRDRARVPLRRPRRGPAAPGGGDPRRRPAARPDRPRRTPCSRRRCAAPACCASTRLEDCWPRPRR